MTLDERDMQHVMYVVRMFPDDDTYRLRLYAAVAAPRGVRYHEVLGHGEGGFRFSEVALEGGPNLIGRVHDRNRALEWWVQSQRVADGVPRCASASPVSVYEE